MRGRICKVLAIAIAAAALTACGGGGESDNGSPGTQAGYVDYTAPAVTGWAPPATDASVNAAITAAFTEPLQHADIAVQEQQNPSVSVQGSVQVIADTVTFTPATNLKPGTPYTVNVTATDAAGNSQEASYTFTTSTAADVTPPEVVVGSESPSNGATAVPANASISIAFNEPIFPFLFGAIDGVPTDVSFDYTENRVTITPVENLRAGTYTTYVRASDLAGNIMPAPFLWSFTVAASP